MKHLNDENDVEEIDSGLKDEDDSQDIDTVVEEMKIFQNMCTSAKKAVESSSSRINKE